MDASAQVPGLTAGGAEAGLEGQAETLLSDLGTLGPAGPTPLLGQLGKHATVLAFVGGILLGWLVIGWLLWPAQLTGSYPKDLQITYQKRYVALVAAEHWKTRDAGQAKADLAGWDTASLAPVLTAIEREAASAEPQQQVAALRQALALPDPEATFPASLLRQRTIVWSTAVAVLLQVAALVLLIVPRFASGIGRRLHDRSGEGSEGVLAAGQEEGTLAPWLEAFQEPAGEAQGPVSGPQPPGQPGGGSGQADGKPGAQQDERVQAGAQGQAAAQGQAQVGAQGQTPAKTQAQAGAQRQTPTPAQARKTAPPPGERQAAEESVDLHEDADAVLSDLLDGIGSEDPRREALARITDDVAIAGLLQQSREVLVQLQGLTPVSSPEAT